MYAIRSYYAPIFFNTAQDSGALPLRMDVTKMNMGDVITINTAKGEVSNAAGEVISTFEIKPDTVADEYRAGGRIPLIIGRSVTAEAREALGMGATDVFIPADNPTPKAGQGYSQAQKIVGRACGVDGILPGRITSYNVCYTKLLRIPP